MMDYYGDDRINFIMGHNKTYPRYAGLARKVISHYLGDRYDPNTFDFEIEINIRGMIRDLVELKVLHKQPYDWPVIDHFFRYRLNVEGFSDITYDMAVIERGYNGVNRGELPMHSA